MLAILGQKIKGGGYTIGLLTFTTLEESVTYCLRHFPVDTCDYIVGIVGLIGIHLRISCQPIYNREPNADEHQNRDFPRHSVIVALFSGSYPVILSAPKEASTPSRLERP